MNEFATLISSIGFPCVVALVMLQQNQKMSEIISENTKTIAELKTVISEHLKTCGVEEV